MYKHMTKILLVFVLGLMVTNCSTYKMKSDFNGKNGVVNKVPKWYVKYPHTTKKKYQEAATAVSPDLELAVKKATLLEMNNRTTINKNEAGTNESLTVTAGSQDIIVNVINDTLVKHYMVNKQIIYTTKHKSYRVYVMVEISKDHIATIISEINAKKVAQLNTSDIDAAAKKVLNN